MSGLSNNRNFAVVGAFLLIGILCLAWLAFSVGSVRGLEAGHYPVSARFGSVSGLREGAYVELAGVRVGKVSSISIDTEYYEAIVLMQIRNEVQLQEDAIASIRTAGIIGEKFVKLTPGGSDAYVGSGGQLLETESSISIEELISKYIFESGK